MASRLLAGSWFIFKIIVFQFHLNKLQIFVPMQDLITSFIIQSKECKLRDVGRFKVVTNAAELDIANKRITPPVTEIIFSGREEKISDGLVKYVAEKKRIPVAEALDDLKKWCAASKEKLKNGGEILLEPLGVLKKGNSGTTFVQSKNNIVFFEPVAAERVIHINSEHAVLVGDRETTSSVMTQFYNEETGTQKRNSWKIVAVIFLALALFLLFIHFYGNSFSLSTIGNQHKIIPATAPDTYINH